MNGSEPVSGTHAKLKSSVSQDLTMFAGDFKAVSINGNYFLNPDADDQQLTELEKTFIPIRTIWRKNWPFPIKERRCTFKPHRYQKTIPGCLHPIQPLSKWAGMKA